MPRLSELTTLRLGGEPRRYVAARTERDVAEAVLAAQEAGERVLVLGGGSNLVVADEGFDGTVVHVLTRGVAFAGAGRVTVAAGEPWDPFVARTVALGLAGVECLSGIPGSTGATPIQNVGAYGQEVAETITSVRVLERATGDVRELAPAECAFAYRDSRFKRRPDEHVVLAVGFRLHERDGDSMPVAYAELARRLGVPVGGRAPVGDVREAVLALRRGKGMVIDPDDLDSRSAGSFFTNPILAAGDLDEIARRAGADPPAYPQADGSIKTSAAWLIQHAGFARGYGAPDGIAISTKHVLALTNRGAGTTRELLALRDEIVARVEERFGVRLVPEPVHVR